MKFSMIAAVLASVAVVSSAMATPATLAPSHKSVAVHSFIYEADKVTTLPETVIVGQAPVQHKMVTLKRCYTRDLATDISATVRICE